MPQTPAPRTTTLNGPFATGGVRDPQVERSGVGPSPDQRGRTVRRALRVVDALALGTGWAVALVISLWSTSMIDPLELAVRSAVVVGGGLILCGAAGLYLRRVCGLRSLELARSAWVAAGAALLTAGFVPAAGDRAIQLGVVAGVVSLALLGAGRGLFREWVRQRRSAGELQAPILVVGGDGTAVDTMSRLLDDAPMLGFSVIGAVSLDPDTPEDGDCTRWPGSTQDLVAMAADLGATGLALVNDSLDPDTLNALVREATDAGLHVHVHTGLREVHPNRMVVSTMVDEAFLQVTPIRLPRYQQAVKRGLDVVLGGLALLAFAPIMLVAAVIIRSSDGGPVLFRQERVGLDGDTFELFKLRTMSVDAEERLHDVREAQGNARDGPLFKVARDPRVTRFGRFLRASSIDELPQLFNVLRGEMSLVGPRPALVAEVAQFDDHLRQRLFVRPGITGLWQVEARDEASFELYRRFDVLYTQNWSVLLDLAIIARTLTVVGLRALLLIWPFGRSARDDQPID